MHARHRSGPAAEWELAIVTSQPVSNADYPRDPIGYGRRPPAPQA
ncbi:hypothetical protein [Bordetella genomosp. 1]|nr:hypothetical protein [Bordetella genomosp. 1]